MSSITEDGLIRPSTTYEPFDDATARKPWVMPQAGLVDLDAMDTSKNQGRAGDVIRTQAEVDTHVAFWTWTAILLFVALFVGFFGWHAWNWVKGGK